MRNFSSAISNQINSEVIDWVKTILANGGAMPSQKTIYAANSFMNGLIATGLFYSMQTVNIFAPDSLIACRVPLVANSGNTIYTNTGFTAAHLSVNGLQGAAGRYWDTGVNCRTVFGTANGAAAGMTLYVQSGNSNSENDMGVWAASSPTFGAYVSFAGTCYFDCWNSGNDRISAANAAYTGFITFNRTGTNNTRVDTARSNLAYSTIASATNSSTSAPPNVTVQVYRQKGSTTACTKRFCFCAVHTGLQFDQGQKFFTLVQKLRNDLGGGAV